MYKGVLKITYDRGYVLQTKSVLTESNSTVEEVIDQLIDALGLTGSCDDYVLEERNLISNGNTVERALCCFILMYYAEIRPMKKTELPLKLHLQYGVDSPCLDIRLVQVRDSRVHMHRGEGAGESYSDEEDDEDDITTGTPPSLVPKDEGEKNHFGWNYYKHFQYCITLHTHYKHVHFQYCITMMSCILSLQ